MSKRILLIGRKGFVVSDAQAKLNRPDLQIYTATNVDEVKVALETVLAEGSHLDHVFMGAGIDLEQRLEVISTISKAADKTTVHLKDIVSGPTGFFPFVRATLEGLDRYEVVEFNAPK